MKIKIILGVFMGMMVLTYLVACVTAYIPIPEGRVVEFGELEEYYDLPSEQRYGLELGSHLAQQHILRYRAKEEFSGAWFCRVGHFNVALTIDPDDKIDGIVYHQHQFSWDYLVNIVDFIGQLELESFISAGVNERLNHVEVELLSSGEQAAIDINQIINHLRSAELWQFEALLFITGAEPIVVLPAPELLIIVCDTE